MGHGLFVDCSAYWEGRIGPARVRLAKREGGAVELFSEDGKGGVIRLAVRVRVVGRGEGKNAQGGRDVLIRQENDPAPKFSFLEEGPVRLGMRVAFDLLDEQGRYHGDGRLDVWLYPENDAYVTYSIETQDALAHASIEDCFLEASGGEGLSSLTVDKQTVETGKGEAFVPFGKELANKRVIFAGTKGAAGLYWMRDTGIAWKFACDAGTLPPYYASRWPTGMQQWVIGTDMGWALAPGSGVGGESGDAGPTARFYWRRKGTVLGQVRHGASLGVSWAGHAEDVSRRIEAAQNPLQPRIVGGEFRCWSDEDGLCEIGQRDPTQVTLVFPPDPLERVVRVRWFRRKTDLKHGGAVVAKVDGRVVQPQLVSDGDLTDDICVVMEMSPRTTPADDVIVSLRLQAQRATELKLEKQVGIQAAYQSEITGIDLQRRYGNRRDLTIWSSRDDQRPWMEFDLFSCAAHRLNKPGQSVPVVWEMPMAWFRSCGHSRYDYCNSLEEFRIEKNGPEEVRLYARSFNPGRRACSELWLRIPHDRPRLEARMRLEVLEPWENSHVEFTDIFPYPTRMPQTWVHQAALFLQRDSSALIYTQRPDCSSPGQPSKDDRLFYALFAAERGNILTLFRNRTPPRHPWRYAVCGNYIDIHVHFTPKVQPVPAGEVFEVEYACEIYGDAHTSVDELTAIGRRALESGELAL